MLFRSDGDWRRNTRIDLELHDRRVWIEIPTGFTEMQRSSPELALKWRLELRDMFESYLSRGYRAVDFALRRDHGYGRYLLALPEAP